MGYLAIASMLAGLSLAQAAGPEPEQASENEIIVEGSSPLDRDEVAELIREGYPSSVRWEPLMRYHDPICLQVNGLGPSGNAEVLGYMRETISSLSIRLSGQECRANAVVVVATDPVAQLERLHANSPKVLSAKQLEELVRELEEGAHAVVWHNSNVRGADGERLPFQGSVAGWTGKGGIDGALINNNGRPTLRRASYALAAEAGVVVYDATKLDTVELRQLANNAVMRLLAPGFAIDVEPGSPKTVLSGIEEGTGPDTLTRFDRAMLTALYAMTPNEYGRSLGQTVGRAYERAE